MKTLGESIVNGCASLIELSVPAGVTEAGSWSEGCLAGSSVEALIIEPGMTVVPEYLAKNCESLRKVYLPDSVGEIGQSAFEGCKNLEVIKSTRTTFAFSSRSFAGCEKLDDPRFSVLDFDSTYLAANSELASMNGIIHYTLKYKLMPSVAASAENIRLHLDLPEGLTLLLDSVQSKNLTIDAEDIANGEVAVDGKEGELRFSVRVTDIGDYQVSAYLTFDYNNSDWEQTIGRMNVDCPNITCCSLEKTNSFEINVYGIAQRDSEVKIFVDDKLTGTVNSNSYTGKYTAAIVLPKKKSGETYRIYAQCNGDSSEEINVVYVDNQPAVKRVFMIFNDHENERMDITNVFTEGVSPVISYNPAYPLVFEIETDHTEQIYRLFVTSKKGNSEKQLEAFWNKDKQLWVTEGYFDEFNHNYIPGALNIRMQTFDDGKSDETDLIPEEFNIEPNENVIANSHSETVAQSDSETLEKIVVSDGEQSEEIYHYISESQGIIVNGQEISTEEIVRSPEKYGYSKVPYKTEQGGQVQTYYIKPVCGTELPSKVGKDYDKFANMYGMSIVSGDEVINEIWINTVPENVVTLLAGKEAAEAYSTVGAFVSLGSAMAYYYQNCMNASDENGMALARMMYAYSVTSLSLGVMISAVNPLAGVLWNIATGLGRIYLQNKMDQYYKNCGNVRMIIDPSGVVFEAVIGNPVEGATMTVYFKDAETGEEVKWNAEDYDQINPLLTDKEGKYLWDVPEGEWKVVCEKDGYESAESEWMTIPPVRTEVNFQIVSKAAPEIVSAEAGENGVTVKLSKFADISTVTSKSLVLESVTDAYTVSPVLVNEDDKYADTFVLSGKSVASATGVTVTETVKSYAGTAAKKATFNMTAAQEIHYGDVNDDGSVDLKDVVMMRRALAGGWELSINEAAADVNKDGSFDLKDVVILRRYLAGGWDLAVG